MEKEEREKRLESALKAIKNGDSVRHAALQFNIPRTTLSDRHNGNTKSSSAGAQPVLSKEEEKRFVEVRVVFMIIFNP